MKQVTRTLCAVGLGLLTLLSSCDKRNNRPTPPPPNPDEVTPLKLPAHLLFLTTVTGGNGTPSASYLISTIKHNPLDQTFRLSLGLDYEGLRELLK